MPKAQVIGLGRSGIAAASVLNRNGWEVTLSDSASIDSIAARPNYESLQKSQQQLTTEGVTVKLAHKPTLDRDGRPDLIVVSPGVPWDIPLLVEARNLGIDTIGELELAWRYLKTVPWVGITGTNGKTTTTALIAAIFQAAGLNAPACGNIGYAACELALHRRQEVEDDRTADEKKLDWIVAEISSYQIESSIELAPEIAIFTTLTPDHLARHKTLEKYYQIKASLLDRSPQKIINGDDPYLRDKVGDRWNNVYWTSVKGKDRLKCDRAKGVYIEDGWVVAFGELILPISLFKMIGVHNQQNLLLAVAAAKLAGIDKEAIASAIANFGGVSHRLEYICTRAGVDYVNDSKATNYDAAEVGLTSVNAPVILIAGGEAKQGDDNRWIETIKAKAAGVLLIGEAAPVFAVRLQQSGYESYEIVETMENAVCRAVEFARNKNAKVVLLSPACASFDQYQSFEHRGDRFRELCLQL
ncbi:MAG: UDP-N-acetylmuramoyl-L-alanine--D-glutamate ligase [Prochloraceae cyanobacterium]|nr:UDP-N-acetylmuramoyl-L-alanine--D-glutamate ligase [Prochloraceae cyanobacterium]